MPRTRPAYSEEFRKEAVEMVRGGRSAADVAKVRVITNTGPTVMASSGPTRRRVFCWLDDDASGL